MNERRLIIQGCSLVRTCYACPEQYDVFFGDFELGYLRLRHGGFTTSLYGPDGMDVYSANPRGDGIFEDNERMKHLNRAVEALLEAHNEAVIKQLDSEVY